MRKSHKMPFWFHEESSLSIYHTLKEDKKQGISRIPRQKPIVSLFQIVIHCF